MNPDRRILYTDEPKVESLADLDPPPKWAIPAAIALGVVVWTGSAIGVGVVIERHREDVRVIRADELAAQGERDREYADSLTAGCLSKATADRLLFAATYAAHATLSGAETMDAFRGMLPAPRIEYTVDRP